MENKSYVVWDLETSGLDCNTCDVLEIGAIEVVDGKVIAEHNWLLNHGKPVPAEIVRITGITDELIKEKGVDPLLALNGFLEVLRRYDTYVTHNGIKFDVPFFVAQADRILVKEAGDYDVTLMHGFHKDLMDRMIDTAVICKARKINLPRRENETFKAWADRVMAVRAFGVKYNVGIMCDELGIDKSQVTQHRALGDVLLTNEIFKKVYAAA